MTASLDPGPQPELVNVCAICGDATCPACGYCVCCAGHLMGCARKR